MEHKNVKNIKVPKSYLYELRKFNSSDIEKSAFTKVKKHSLKTSRDLPDKNKEKNKNKNSKKFNLIKNQNSKKITYFSSKTNKDKIIEISEVNVKPAPFSLKRNYNKKIVKTPIITKNYTINNIKYKNKKSTKNKKSRKNYEINFPELISNKSKTLHISSSESILNHQISDTNINKSQILLSSDSFNFDFKYLNEMENFVIDEADEPLYDKNSTFPYDIDIVNNDDDKIDQTITIPKKNVYEFKVNSATRTKKAKHIIGMTSNKRNKKSARNSDIKKLSKGNSCINLLISDKKKSTNLKKNISLPKIASFKYAKSIFVSRNEEKSRKKFFHKNNLQSTLACKPLSIIEESNNKERYSIKNYHYLENTISTKNKIVKKAEKTEIKKTKQIITEDQTQNIRNTLPYKKSFNSSNNTVRKKLYDIKNKNILEESKNNLYNINKKKKENCCRAVSSINTKANTASNNMSTISSTTLSSKIFNGQIEDYLMTKELGKGSYAVVKLAINKYTREKFAIKIYKKENLLDPKKRNTVKNEINILKQLDHENIMKLYEVIENPSFTYLVLEYINGISLLEVLKNEKNHFLEEKRAINIFIQVLKGIKFCENKNIFHRDIKLENILLIKDDIIKIIDFGFAIQCSKNTYQKLLCGSISYMPPEIVNKTKYIAQYSDIWSLGVLLYVMLYGKFPFMGDNEDELFEKINQAELEFDDEIIVSDKIKNLFKKIFVIEPTQRPSLDEILNYVL